MKLKKSSIGRAKFPAIRTGDLKNIRKKLEEFEVIGIDEGQFVRSSLYVFCVD